ncbi:hypothetical protein BROUX41_000266 [Berkeleyomyces rouxiae]|uniref:uncharacterized protein n=1 Tax=Berkeleyomyces rouxiae TaxID=2035830 RepID=UPI003B8191BA
MVTSYLQPGQADLPSKKATASYWHREPSRTLLGHRTTEILPGTADVVIVGSGITGAFAAKTAKEAWARDLSVVMLEAREACWGATGRNGGHCQPNTYASKPHIAEFEMRTFDYLKDIVEANAIPCHWTSLTGCHALFTQNLVDRAAANLEHIRRADPKLEDAAALITHKHKDPEAEMSLGELRITRACGAVVQRRAASLWPYKLVCWVLEDLLARFTAESFALHTLTAVDSLQRCGNVWLVHTNRGVMAAKQVLVATNAYTSRILPGFARIIVPVRGQVAALVPRAGCEERVGRLRNSYVFLGEPEPASAPVMDDYLVQVAGPGRGEFIFGGARALGVGRGVGVSADDEIDADVAEHLVRGLPGVLDMMEGVESNGQQAERKTEGDNSAAAKPNGVQFSATHEWTGIMGFSADGHPWVGRVPENAGGSDAGLWMCAGYTGHGMAGAALAAKAVVELMGGRDVGDVDLPSEYMASSERYAAAAAAAAAAAVEMVAEADGGGVGEQVGRRAGGAETRQRWTGI